jgi:hypothetical protein
MFDGTDSVLKSVPVASNISYKSFKILPMKNSYCDHRNFDSEIVKSRLKVTNSKYINIQVMNSGVK